MQHKAKQNFKSKAALLIFLAWMEELLKGRDVSGDESRSFWLRNKGVQFT